MIMYGPKGICEDRDFEFFNKLGDYQTAAEEAENTTGNANATSKEVSEARRNDGNADILESLYTNQHKWVKGSSIEEANKNLQIFLKNEGFSIDFESCVNNKNIEDFVLNDRIEGAKNFKISSTPTIIINNKKFEKKLNYKNLKKALEKMI